MLKIESTGVENPIVSWEVGADALQIRITDGDEDAIDIRLRIGRALVEAIWRQLLEGQPMPIDHASAQTPDGLWEQYKAFKERISAEARLG